MEKKRINYISIAKAIGIILVVAGHCIYGEITNFIYLFHMPMFFMISGYLYNNNSDIKNYISRKIKSIYIPYVSCNFFFLLFHNFFFEIGFYKESALNLYILDKKSFWKDIIGVFSLTHMEQVAAPTWYLRVLLFAAVFYMILNKCITNTVIKMTVAISLYVMDYILYYNRLISNSILTYGCLIIMAVVFMYWGHLYRVIESIIPYKKIYLGIAFAGLLLLNKAGHISIVSLEWENPVFLFFSSFLGTFFVFGLSSLLDKTVLKNVMVVIGNNSLIILLLHCVVFKMFNILHGIITDDMSNLWTIANADTTLWIILYTAGGVFIPLILELAVERLRRRGNKAV